ncbi:MAG: response regulator transcription factor [Alphaproteobacteria bacterium]|nr:response regulator transcription factor [Alphaproteobacteria bacterium]
MSHRRTVYVVERELAARRLLISHLAQIGAEPWPFAGGDEFLGMLEHVAPACVLLDMDLEAPDGLAVLAELGRRQPDWPVVGLSGRGDLPLAVEAMKLGALDFLEKPASAARLAAALAPAWTALERAMEAGEARRIAGERLARLTRRELDISLGLFSGRSNKAIAHDLGISVRTVEMHRAHVMAKLGVRSLAEAAVLATQAGLAITPGYLRRAIEGHAPSADRIPDFLGRRVAAGG